MKTKKIVTYQYIVTDAFGYERAFESKDEAISFEKVVNAEKDVLSNLRPNGVTLVVSKDEDAFAKCVPAFVGYNGLPFAQCDKDKRREHFWGSVPRSSHEDIYGGIVDVLKMTMEKVRGWVSTHGNDSCEYILHPVHWTEGALWYNWDGEKFTTNDEKCCITSKDFQ